MGCCVVRRPSVLPHWRTPLRFKGLVRWVGRTLPYVQDSPPIGSHADGGQVTSFRSLAEKDVNERDWQESETGDPNTPAAIGAASIEAEWGRSTLG